MQGVNNNVTSDSHMAGPFGRETSFPVHVKNDHFLKCQLNTSFEKVDASLLISANRQEHRQDQPVDNFVDLFGFPLDC